MLSINMTLCDLNCLSPHNENEISGITITAKIIGLIMYLLYCLGISSLLGVIHYEKYGQDPQKRSFADQLFTFNCKIVIIVFPIFLGIGQIRCLFGPVGYTIALFRFYLASSLLCIPFGCTESILFRFLMIYSWRKCALINDEFCAMFFNVFNFILAQMISIIRLMMGRLITKETFTLLSGVEVNVEEPRLVQTTAHNSINFNKYLKKIHSVVA